MTVLRGGQRTHVDLDFVVLYRKWPTKLHGHSPEYHSHLYQYEPTRTQIQITRKETVGGGEDLPVETIHVPPNPLFHLFIKRLHPTTTTTGCFETCAFVKTELDGGAHGDATEMPDRKPFLASKGEHGEEEEGLDSRRVGLYVSKVPERGLKAVLLSQTVVYQINFQPSCIYFL